MKRIRMLSVTALCMFLLIAFMPAMTVSGATIQLPREIHVYVGSSQPLQLSGTSKTPKWSSSNKNVATVTSGGTVAGVGAGTAKIRARLGSKTYTCKVYVKDFVKYTVSVNKGNSYATAPGNVTTSFTSGQNADLALSSFGINKAKSATTYNHPNGIVTNGSKFVVCDSWNNRVLIYNSLPTSKSASPSVVLGQTSFTSSKAGYSLSQMNWPVGAAMTKDKLFIADTHNNRILVWNSIPTSSGTPADYSITMYGNGSQDYIEWPWAIWTNGEKLVVTNTRSGQLLIWNTLPTGSDSKADIVIKTGGTPRTIVSNGTYLLVGDHNMDPEGTGCRVWTSFPTSSNDTQDFKCAIDGDQPGGCIVGKKLVLLNSGRMYIYNSLPKSASALRKPNLTVGNGMSNDFKDKYYYFATGDYNQCLYANGRLYASLYNSNKIIAFKGLPKKKTSQPAFALSGTTTNNTLLSNGLIMNPNVATDGKSLVAVSEFDLTLSIWNKIPDSPAVKADVVYKTDPLMTPNDVAVYKQKLVVATDHSLMIWNKIPTKGQKWNTLVSGKIGSVVMSGINSISMDAKHFYISDKKTNKVYIYNSIPGKTTKPVATISGISGKLTSDGDTLTVARTGLDGGLCKEVLIYDISDLSNITRQTVNGYTINGNFINFNDATDCVLADDGRLMIADANNHYVLIWNSISDAVNKKEVAAYLGHGQDYYDSTQIPGGNTFKTDVVEIAGAGSLCMPTFLAYDGNYLWVGEFKFSSRLMRFSGK
ncbi:Ig-like domain-containing protein [Aminicella lysinilytica]|uniref:Ig-like domain-containing protein n=1 Tax=Aminicella lysinilytica TaxID=433323 RepID=UPI0026EA5AF6|nr:Ig-like domain-containing protein [Aminicella lysinilytica]